MATKHISEGEEPVWAIGLVSEEKVKEVLRSKVDPYLAFEGGSVELVSVEGGRVKVRLSGACAGCPMRQFTIKRFIEAVLKREVPEVRAVEAVEEGRPTQ